MTMTIDEVNAQNPAPKPKRRRTAKTKEAALEAATNESWEPVSALHVPKEIKEDAARRGVGLRWVEEGEQFERRYNEGWRPNKYEDTELVLPRSIIDGAQSDGTKRYRGLILCEMPLARIEARKRYYDKKTDQQTTSIRRRAKRGGLVEDEFHQEQD